VYISEIIFHIKLHIDKLEQTAAIHNHNTWQMLKLHVQFCWTNVLKKGVMNMGIKLYNKLPNKIREMEKMSQLKRELRSYLLQHTFTIRMNMYHVKLVGYDIWVRSFLWIVSVFRGSMKELSWNIYVTFRYLGVWTETCNWLHCITNWQFLYVCDYCSATELKKGIFLHYFGYPTFTIHNNSSAITCDTN
jgi:hypothetical protein